MTSEEITEALRRLLAAHGVETAEKDGWLHCEDGSPALRARWQPGPWPKEPGLLDVQVALPDGRRISECFVGIGEEPQGSRDALKSFILSSLHVLLASLWQRGDDGQVERESWTVGDQTWKVYIGDFVRRISDADVEPPGDAFHVIEHAARRERLSPGVHWIRTYFCDPGNGEWVIEALLDNETWTAGAEAYAGVAWPTGKGFYSVRNFLILDVGASPAPTGV